MNLIIFTLDYCENLYLFELILLGLHVSTELGSSDLSNSIKLNWVVNRNSIMYIVFDFIQ